MLKINGENCEADGANLAALIKERGYNADRIAVELNGEIVPKSEYKNIVLKEGDSLEVVSFVGGG